MCRKWLSSWVTHMQKTLSFGNVFKAICTCYTQNYVYINKCVINNNATTFSLYVYKITVFHLSFICKCRYSTYTSLLGVCARIYVWRCHSGLQNPLHVAATCLRNKDGVLYLLLRKMCHVDATSRMFILANCGIHALKKQLCIV